MELTEALEYLRPRRNGVLVTLKRDGRPQLSNITFVVEPSATIAISVTASRAKSRNAGRDRRVSLYATAEDFWSYVVVEGDASLTPPAGDPHDDTVEQLVVLYRSLAGEHPDWDDYRAAMVADRRQVLRITPTHAYGMV
jgi:PPOX class probable F420-dependent enzyme